MVLSSGPGHNEDEVVELEAYKALNIANIANLTCTTVSLKDKADRVIKTWMETNAMRVEIMEACSELPLNL